MRAFLIRVIFLLISANLAYGSGGDFYAEKVQALVNSCWHQKFHYKPHTNSELFYQAGQEQATQPRRLSHGDLFFYQRWLASGRNTTLSSRLNIEWLFSVSSVFAIQKIACTLYPRHFFF